MNMNSKEYWNERFKGDWNNKGGKEQTIGFGKIMLENFPYWLDNELRINTNTMCDAGCALGGIMHLIHEKYPKTKISGFDFSKEAIDKAKEEYPLYDFFVEQIDNLDKKFDIIYSSNTLEHFSEPLPKLRKLIQNSKKHVIIMVPYKQYDYCDEHETFFDLNTFPLVLDNFVLSFFKIIDASKYENTPWNDKQIMVIYSSTEEIIGKKLKLRTLIYDFESNNEYVSNLIKSKIEIINNLNFKVQENEKQILNLQNEKERIISLLEAENRTFDEYTKMNNEHIKFEKTIVDFYTNQENIKTSFKGENLENQIKELNEKINYLHVEKEELSKKINYLYVEKEELSRKVNYEIDQLKYYKNLLNEIVINLNKIFWSHSEKIACFVRMVKFELKNSIKNFILIFPKLVLKVFGKRDVFKLYVEKDPFRIQINKLQELVCLSENYINSKEQYSAFNAVFKTDVENCNEIDNIKSNNNKRIAYFTNQVVDWVDGRPRYGGGEKYLLNICNILSKYGYEIDIYQPANEEFETKYYGYTVKTIKNDGDFYSEFPIGIANKFYDISLEYDHVIYNLPEFTSQKVRKDALMICHGIWFDHNNYGEHIKFREEKWFKFLKNAFSNPLKIVSVDTNSINVIRSLFPKLTDKMTFIPNFVDTKKFRMPEKRKNDKLTIIFPRRAQINRGSRILEDILKHVPYDVNFYWIGEGDKEDNEIIENLCKKDKRLKFNKADFNEMVKWYQTADITVVPTIACEGTSLSAIEGLACGSAVISTNVGGLTDVVFNEINGLSVNATAKDIANAINRLIEDKKLRERLQKAGNEFAKSLSVESWTEKWLEVFYDLKGIPKPKNKDKKICIITRNAVHGGVESLIKSEMKYFNADVIVTGGLNDPYKSCPFEYKYIENYKKLLSELLNYDICIYHYIPDWAVMAVKHSNIKSIEFVHRVDTAESDKTVPTEIASHSQYVLDYIDKNNKNHTKLNYVANGIDMNEYTPMKNRNKNKYIGAVTSYYYTKGIDILIKAWNRVDKNLKAGYKLKLMGAGTDLPKFKELAEGCDDIQLLGPTTKPKELYDELCLYVTAARIEGLPISVLEAMSCNLPIIASDIEGHRVINDMAKDAHLEEPLDLFNDEDELVEKIENYLKKPYKVETRKVIEKLFSIEMHCKGLKDIIERIIN